MRELKAKRYRVAVYYFSLSSPALAVRRVRMRVKLGGHNVPEDDIRRRFQRSLDNFFQIYAPLADQWYLFDNSTGGSANLVANEIDSELTVKDQRRWQRLQNLIQPR